MEVWKMLKATSKKIWLNFLIILKKNVNFRIVIIYSFSNFALNVSRTLFVWKVIRALCDRFKQ